MYFFATAQLIASIASLVPALNMDKAASLLKTAGWNLEGGKLMKDGKQMTITVISSQTFYQRAAPEYLQAQWNRLGINTVVNDTDQPTFLVSLRGANFDVVVVAGGRPANFCDLGGGGDAEGVVAALEVITRDPQVKSVLFNIFGGITRGDEVARGILEALDRMKITIPIVVRLDGTNAEEGRKILADAASPNLYVEPTMLDAAKKAVELAR